MDNDIRNETPGDFSPGRRKGLNAKSEENSVRRGTPETMSHPDSDLLKKSPVDAPKPYRSPPTKQYRQSSFIGMNNEEAGKTEDTELPGFSDDRRKTTRTKKIMTLGASVIFILGLAVTRELIRPPETGISTKEAWQVMSELNAAENTGEMGFAEAIETEAPNVPAVVSEEEKAELISQGQESMKTEIFGTDEDQGISPYLTITGMTDKEKRDTGFVETDCLRAAGLFLKDRGISTKRIIVENPVDCSLPNGMAFQGRLEKLDDMSFRFILFPDLPGEYIFMIEEDEEKVQPETLTTENASDTAEQAAGTQTQAAVQTQNSPQTQSQPQSQASQDTDYDARNISISSVPEELLNYMDNRYVFQYSLYDYLFSHGKKEVQSAEVTDYSIDAGTRQATIKLKLTDGSDLTAVYSKSSGSYTFS